SSHYQPYTPPTLQGCPPPPLASLRRPGSRRPNANLPNPERNVMPRVIVTGYRAARAGNPVLLAERIRSVNLSSERSVMRFVERLGWAISDADEAERIQVSRARGQDPRARRPPPGGGPPRARIGATAGRAGGPPPGGPREGRGGEGPRPAGGVNPGGPPRPPPGREGSPPPRPTPPPRATPPSRSRM